MIAEVYSRAARSLYEPLVVHGSFKLFGGRLNELVREQGRSAVSVAAGRPILDVPVGTAYFTSAVARGHAGLVVGVDIAEGMVRESARRRIPNLSPVQADAHALPFEDGAFGAILCTNGLQVIPDLPRAVSELARVLAPGGTLFVSVLSLPVLRGPRIPTVLAARDRVAEELDRGGLRVTKTTRTRLATLFEATRPR